MDPVAAAFEAVPREGFLPRADRSRASYDGPIGIGQGQTNSQPRAVEAMLRLLAVRRGQQVLDVGAGSGWTTALLGHLTGPTGRVRGVELAPRIAQWGADNLQHARMPWTSLEVADPEVLGLPDHAPYDRILVSAEAMSIPEPLIEQLGKGGRMVVPVSGVMHLVQPNEEGISVSRHGYYSFVPLR